MLIRKCKNEDITAVGEFYDNVVKYLNENINYPKWTYKCYPSEESVQAMTQADCQFVCMDNGEILGAFVLNDDPQGKYENATWSRSLLQGEYMVCHTLATAPSIYGKGIGKELVSFCIDYAKSHGFKGIRLDVVPDNIPAKKLYAKCGFRYVGDVDLERGLEEIPEFSMYELDF